MIQIKKKMYLKKKNKLNIRINVTFLIVLLILSVFLCVFFIGNKMNKSLKKYASIETQKFITSLINNTIDSGALNDLSENKLFLQETVDSEFYYTDINRVFLNEILDDIVEDVENSLVNIENGILSDVKLPNSVTNNEYNKMKKGACHSLANVNIIFYCAKWKRSNSGSGVTR